jgi:biotin carboxylase
MSAEVPHPRSPRPSTVVVLGGGEDQIPAYRAAKDMGHHVVGVDIRADCLGASLADEFLPMTSRDWRGIASRLTDHTVAAVISPASDAAQESVAQLSAHFNTPYRISRAALAATVDKVAFHDLTRALGHRGYHYFSDTDLDYLAGSARRNVRLPLITKPCDSSGSKGLSLVTQSSDLDHALRIAAAASPHGRVLVEEYIEGRHFSAECFVEAGHLALVAVTERFLTDLPRLVSHTHLIPADINPETAEKIKIKIVEIADAIGYDWGPLNIDLILTPDHEPIFIEMAARLGGNGMPQLVRSAYGVDTVSAALSLSLGTPTSIAPSQVSSAMLQILSSERDGILAGVAGMEEVLTVPEVVSVELFKGPGDDVQRYTQAGHKIGYAVLVASERTRLLEVREHVLRTLEFQLLETDARGLATNDTAPRILTNQSTNGGARG